MMKFMAAVFSRINSHIVHNIATYTKSTSANARENALRLEFPLANPANHCEIILLSNIFFFQFSLCWRLTSENTYKKTKLYILLFS
mmetsp:Transcript_6561/g.8331  ORF Transcript_6561/g.8331 Transcript_6561/m.8331 type:complete len:86 (+) Transcript_6561:928-1185(+)